MELHRFLSIRVVKKLAYFVAVISAFIYSELSVKYCLLACYLHSTVMFPCWQTAQLGNELNPSCFSIGGEKRPVGQDASDIL